MKIRNVLDVLGVAAATMAFTLLAIGPWNTGISDDAKGIKPRIRQPKFTVQGCEFALKTEKPEYKMGQSPNVELSAVNPTAKTVETTVWVTISAVEKASSMSRVLSMPLPVWSQSWSVRLKPGETKTTKFATDVKLAAEQEVSIDMSDKKQTVMVKELSVRADAKKKTAPASTVPVSPKSPSAAK